jgi:competence ComEA-like helix-hairpin-helix protein
LNRPQESCGDSNPLPGLLLGGVVVLLAQLVPCFSALNGSQVSTPRQVSAPCVYEVVEDKTCLGTVFCDGPNTIPEILAMIGRPERGILFDPDRCVPCGSSIRIVTHSSEMMVRAIPGAQLMAAGKRIDLNRAHASDLASIPGIGPKIAERIVREREHRRGFAGIADLRAIPGIGEKKLQTLAQWLEIGPRPGHCSAVVRDEHARE